MSVIGVKAYNKGLSCRDVQFVEGEIKEHHGEIEICESGFHFCENPLDVLDYYDLCDSEFTTVEALGEVQSKQGDKNTKRVTNKIKIGAKLDLPGFIKASFDFLWEKCKATDIEKASGHSSKLAASGHSSKLAASGDYSQLAASGHSSKLAASGDYSQLAASGHSSKLAASGHSSKLAASGHSSKLAASGDYSKLAASGDSSQLAASGHSSKLAASGHSSQLAASGHSSKLAASGHSSKLALDGDYSVGACVGNNSIIKGKTGCWITLAEWNWIDGKYIPVCVKSAQIDGEALKADTYYKLKNGEFTEED